MVDRHPQGEPLRRRTDEAGRGAAGMRLRAHLRRFFAACKDSLGALMSDNISTHSAALAFYSLFSIAPIVMIAISLAGLIFGGPASRGDIFSAISSVLGQSGAHAIEEIVVNASRHPGTGRIAAFLGLLTLFFGASGAFQQMEQSLDLIWRVEAEPGRGLWTLLRQRLLSFSLVLVIGFLLLISLVASTVIAALGGYLGNRLPGGEFFWQGANFLIAFGLVTILFAAILKILPDVRLAWRDVWMGGAVTAFLFNIGKFAIGLYLGKSSIASSYGAAGSLVAILLWVYYSSFILYFGAELTRFYATHDGRAIEPRTGARFSGNQATS